MRFAALATDYDGTLASDGKVAEQTWESMRRLIASGRKLILVTGREMDELRTICPQLDLFHRIVAENGGLLYRPATGEQQLLAAPPPQEFIRELRARGVSPLDVGQTILAAYRTYESVIRSTIADFGLDLHVIFNNESVMVLPIGVNKASGLKAALDELGLSPRNVVAVGDAENDRDFLVMCGCSVAVANALPMLKQHADLVTNGQNGNGVRELIESILAENPPFGTRNP